MAKGEGDIPVNLQPDPADYGFDLVRALTAVVGIKSYVPVDAFTAGTLGTERAGSGVVIRESGLVATIGYLVTEAETIWLTCADGRAVPGHALAYDQETGFGLVQALGRLGVPALEIGDSDALKLGDPAVLAAAGGVQRAVETRIVGRQEFAGYWEYVLDEAIFTAPAHPYWGGTGLIGGDGRLIGIGSLQLEQAADNDEGVPLNMYVPTDLLKPVLDDMLSMGQPNRPPRPWLGLYATEVDDRVVIAGVSGKGPAGRSLREGDIILSVGGMRVTGLAGLFRKIWSLGNAGVRVPMTIHRDGRPVDVTVPSGDRNRFLKGPSLH